MDTQLLEDLGMSENEIKIYLFLLRTGTSTAPQISKSTRIDKATVYRDLSSLMAKGFASEIIIKNVKSYSAAHPNKLLEKSEMLHLQIEKMIPDLIKLTSMQITNAQVELYQGREGIKFIFQDILNDGLPYLHIGPGEIFIEEISEIYTKIWIAQAEKKGISGRLLIPRHDRVPLTKYEEVRNLPNELASLIATVVYGEKTVLFVMTNPAYVVLVRNKEVADSYRKIFEYIWKKRI